MPVHPVFPWNLKLQQPQLPRSEPDGQPTESSELAMNLPQRRCRPPRPGSWRDFSKTIVLLKGQPTERPAGRTLKNAPTNRPLLTHPCSRAIPTHPKITGGRSVDSTGCGLTSLTTRHHPPDIAVTNGRSAGTLAQADRSNIHAGLSSQRCASDAVRSQRKTTPPG